MGVNKENERESECLTSDMDRPRDLTSEILKRKESKKEEEKEERFRDRMLGLGCVE